MKKRLIYRNHRAITLHLVGLLTLAIPVYVITMIFWDFEHFLSEFSSRNSGIAWAIFMITMSHGTLIAMLWLSGRYVLSITESDTRNETIEVKTWSFIGFYRTRYYPKSILNNSQYNPGTGFYGRGPVVNAPWYQLKTPKGKTLVVDGKGDFFYQGKYQW